MLLETELKKKEQDARKNIQIEEVTGAIAASSIEDNEDHKEGTACAIDTTKKDDRSKTTSSANLVTFSRQKLALIQCEYSSKSCSQCGKSVNIRDMKRCTKCKTAHYCSKECQVKDWEQKHKVHCKEMRRLKEVIHKRLYIPVTIENMAVKVSAALVGQPLELWSTLSYKRIFVYDDKLLALVHFQDTDVVHRFIPVYVLETRLGLVGKGMRECFSEIGQVVYLKKNQSLNGLCKHDIGISRNIAVSTQNTDDSWSTIELYNYPVLPVKLGYQDEQPARVLGGQYDTCGNIYDFEGHLYRVNSVRENIEEIDVSRVPAGPTGTRVSTDIAGLKHVENFCVTRRKDGRKIVVFQYENFDNESVIECMDFRGQHLWRVEKQLVDNQIFSPTDICTDHRGQIFAADPDNNRVIVINEDGPIHTMVSVPGPIVGIVWSDKVQQLYVVHMDKDDKDKDITLFARFSITSQHTTNK